MNRERRGLQRSSNGNSEWGTLLRHPRLQYSDATNLHGIAEAVESLPEGSVIRYITGASGRKPGPDDVPVALDN